MRSIYDMVRDELDAVGVVKIPNLRERLCSSMGAHIMNNVNLKTKNFFDAGVPKNFRVHVCLMFPSGFGKTINMSNLIDPRYGVMAKCDFGTTLSTTFTQESWVGTVNRNTDTQKWEATDGVLVRFKNGIVGADEYARLKLMMESRGEEHDVSYLLSALDKDYTEKQHSGKPIRIEDIGMTFWCGLRPVQMNIADSGLARRFSFQTFYPTPNDAEVFRKQSRKSSKAISEDSKMEMAEKVRQLSIDLAEIKHFDLTDVYRHIDGNPNIPHFEQSIYTRLAIGFAIATDRYPVVTMCKELRELLQDEWNARQHIRLNPEVEMAYAVIKSLSPKANKAVVIQFMHSHYQTSRAKIINLIQSLKYAGRIVEEDGYIIPVDNVPIGDVSEVVQVIL